MSELTSSQKSLISYMGRTAAHAAHGFSLILGSEDPGRFFDDLRAAGMFDPSENPEPQEVEGRQGFVRIPMWPALDYLTRLASIAGEAEDASLGAELMEIVRAVSAGDQERGPIDNYHTNAALAEIISLVPTQCINLEDVDLAEQWLQGRWGNSTIVPKLDNAIGRFLKTDSKDDRDKAVRLLHHCTKLKDPGDPAQVSDEPYPVADPYWLGELLESQARDLGSSAKGEAVDCLLSRLREVFAGDFMARSSWLRRPAIEEHEQNSDRGNASDMYVEAAREALDAWLDVDPENAGEYATNLLSDDAQIVRRLAIHVARRHWDVMEAGIETVISSQLFEPGHTHELYWLLRDRYGDFSPDAQDRVLEVIASSISGLAPESRELAIGMRRQRDWLHAIQGLGYAQVDEAYARVTQEIGPARDHPDFLAYRESWVGTGPSPYTPEEITAFAEDGSLIERIDAFVPPIDEREGSRKSLIDAMSSAVTAGPDRFLWVLSSQEPMSRRIQYGLLDGFFAFIEACLTKEQTSRLPGLLDAYLPYMKQIMVEPGFWDEPIDEPGAFEPNRDWIPPVIGRTVKKLAGDDAAPLSQAHINMMIEAVAVILEHAPGIEVSDDPLTAAINNARGIALEALLQILLRRCRAADQASGDHHAVWSDMRPYFEAELEGCIAGRRLESSALFGTYLAQLHYVDTDWVRAEIEKLFPFKHRDSLNAALFGLAYANFSSRVYVSLKDAGVPRNALALEWLQGSARERLIERVAIAYLVGLEELASPCLAEMFAADRLDDLRELVATTSKWSRDKLNDEQIERITALARKVVAFGMEDPDGRQNLLAIASRYIQVVDNLQEEMDWLVPVAGRAPLSHWNHNFIDALGRLAEVDPERTFVLLEAFLAEYRYSYDYRDRLKTLVRRIHAGGLRTEALRVAGSIVDSGGGSEWTGLYNELLDGEAPVTEPR